MKTDFIAAGCEVWARIDPRRVAFVVANTILTLDIALRLRRHGLPVAVWIYESAAVMAMLDTTPDRLPLGEFDQVWVPGEFQFEELGPGVEARRLFQLRNVVTQPDFNWPAAGPTYAVTDAWEPRKGQAALLALTVTAGIRCEYKFIGSYIPGGLAIGDHAGHRYLGPIHPASAEREIARATSLVSAAETEVQPLTVIESILAGRPALLSDIPAHRILAREFPNAFLFDRRDSTSFAMGWQRMQASLLDTESSLSGRAIAKKRYGGDAFEGRLADLLRSLHAGTDGIPAL